MLGCRTQPLRIPRRSLPFCTVGKRTGPCRRCGLARSGRGHDCRIERAMTGKQDVRRPKIVVSALVLSDRMTSDRMTAPATISALDLAALLCSRLCHDLISPVGAIING